MVDKKPLLSSCRHFLQVFLKNSALQPLTTSAHALWVGGAMARADHLWHCHNSSLDQLSPRISYCMTAPEVLFISMWQAAFERPDIFDRIVTVIVDEAHCVSKW